MVCDCVDGISLNFQLLLTQPQHIHLDVHSLRGNGVVVVLVVKFWCIIKVDLQDVPNVCVWGEVCPVDLAAFLHLRVTPNKHVHWK